MPLNIDPNATFPLVLKTDQGKSRPPTFLFRPPTIRSEAKVSKVYNEAIDGDSQEFADGLIEAVGENMAGWKNMGMEFDKSKIPGLLNSSEAIELIVGFLEYGRVTSEEKKSSESPPSSAAD